MPITRLSVVLGAALLLGACADDVPASTASPTQPATSATVSVAPATQENEPTTTVAPKPAATDTDTEAPPQEESQRVTGVVAAVDGDLSEIRTFSLLLPDGSALTFRPEEGLLFDGGPLSHVRDHMVSGTPVAVEYRHGDDDVAVATTVGDAE